MATFDLGNILRNVETIKGMRRQGVLDDLQKQYLTGQMERAETTFSQQQQVENTKLLNMAAAEVAQNPQAVARWLPQLQQAGVLAPNMDLSAMPPEQLQALAGELYESTSQALQAYQGMDDGRRVQSTQIDREGNTWAVYSDGTTENLGISQQQYANRPIEIELGDGRRMQVAFDPGRNTWVPVAGLSAQQPSMGQAPAAPLGISRAPEEEAAAVAQAQASVEQQETDERKQQARVEIAELAARAVGNPATLNVYGSVQGRMPTVRQGTEDAEAAIDQIIAKLSLESREKMRGSGQVSDFESRLLGQSATILANKRISDEAAMAELQKIAGILSGDMPAIQTDQEYEALQSGQQYIAPDGSVRTKR